MTEIETRWPNISFGCGGQIVYCAGCGCGIDPQNEPYIKVNGKYVHDDVECEDKAKGEQI